MTHSMRYDEFRRYLMELNCRLTVFADYQGKPYDSFMDHGSLPEIAKDIAVGCFLHDFSAQPLKEYLEGLKKDGFVRWRD